MPDTVEDDEESSGSPSDDLESAVPVEKKQGAPVKFGWIKGVLVSSEWGYWRLTSFTL